MTSFSHSARFYGVWMCVQAWCGEAETSTTNVNLAWQLLKVVLHHRIMMSLWCLLRSWPRLTRVCVYVLCSTATSRWRLTVVSMAGVPGR